MSAEFIIFGHIIYFNNWLYIVLFYNYNFILFIYYILDSTMQRRKFLGAAAGSPYIVFILTSGM